MPTLADLRLARAAAVLASGAAVAGPVAVAGPAQAGRLACALPSPRA